MDFRIHSVFYLRKGYQTNMKEGKCMFSAVNTIWVLVGAALVFFMQAGFAMVETCLLYTSRCV